MPVQVRAQCLLREASPISDKPDKPGVNVARVKLAIERRGNGVAPVRAGFAVA